MNNQQTIQELSKQLEKLHITAGNIQQTLERLADPYLETLVTWESSTHHEQTNTHRSKQQCCPRLNQLLEQQPEEQNQTKNGKWGKQQHHVHQSHRVWRWMSRFWLYHWIIRVEKFDKKLPYHQFIEKVYFYMVSNYKDGGDLYPLFTSLIYPLNTLVTQHRPIKPEPGD